MHFPTPAHSSSGLSKKMKQLHFQKCLAVCTSDEVEPCKKKDIWQRTDKSSSCDITCNIPADYRENISCSAQSALIRRKAFALLDMMLTSKYLIICLCPWCVCKARCACILQNCQIGSIQPREICEMIKWDDFRNTYELWHQINCTNCMQALTARTSRPHTHIAIRRSFILGL